MDSTEPKHRSKNCRMPQLTIARPSPKDPIKIPVAILNTTTDTLVWGVGLFDTGNDHTVVSKSFLDRSGVVINGDLLPVIGVTGNAIAQVAIVSLGIEFDGGHKVTITNHEVAVLAGTSEDILIGRDFLERFDISISRNGTFTMHC